MSLFPAIETDELRTALAQAAELLRQVRRLAVLTGAGVSDAFRRNPNLVWRFYNARRAALRSAQPNPGHRALAALEDHFTHRPSTHSKRMS
jgi:NAD-dependent SIR2 family protein deacetylase